MDSSDKDKIIRDILNNTAKSSSDIPDITDDLDNNSLNNENIDIKSVKDESKNDINVIAFENTYGKHSDGLLPEDKMPPKPKKSSNKKRKKKKKTFLLVLAAVIIVAAAIISTVIISIGKDFLGIRGGEIDTTNDISDSLVEIQIPQGATGQTITQILKDNEIIKYSLVFRVYIKFQNPENITAGKHLLSNKMSYEMILDELQKSAINEQTEVSVTFPEGYNLIQCAQLLEKNEVCNADEFIKAFNSYHYGFNFEDKIEESSMKLFKMEGYLFPDTYIFYKNSEVNSVCYKIFSNFAEKVNRNDLGRMSELGLTLDQTITLASIVQAEAGIEREMKNVASVFLNRLKNSEEYPKLQSDPTKKYAREVVKPNLGDKSEELVTAYNTYLSDGLPPGAICNPGYTAIKAVLYSSDTDYYFFCSNLDTQEFFYARTNAEHEKNLKQAGLEITGG